MIRERAPYKVLFSNDTTNIQTCSSHYHKQRNDPFTDGCLRATVDEVADAGPGVVHILQNGAGQVPWWKSRAYPFEEHMKFMKETYGADPSQSIFAQYMADGGDMMATFTGHCKKRGVPAFFSMRMNDSHSHEYTYRKNAIEEKPACWHIFTKWMYDNGHLRVTQNYDDWNGRVFNFIHPEVRSYRLAFVQEIIEDYDVDGFELDFVRHDRLFDYITTSFEERRAIMNEMIGKVRGWLDAKGGRYRFLCVRIPAWSEILNTLGISIPDIIERGVDMINASVSFYTEQESELSFVIKEAAGKVPVYYEMCSYAALGKATKNWKHTYDNSTFMRVTDEMYNGTAHLAYEKGADGVSFFNFVYYREHGSPGRGPFNEPPFHVLGYIGDKEVVAAKKCHYYLIKGFTSNQLIDTHKQLVRRVDRDGTQNFTFEVGKVKETSARIRIVAEEDITSYMITAELNGAPIPETGDVSEFYDKPYVNLVPGPDQCKAFAAGAALFKEGANKLALEISGVDDPFTIIMVETVV